MTQEEQLLLCDAQTSGGLLAAVAADQAEAAIAALCEAGVSAAAVIGSVEPSAPGRMVIDRARVR